MTTSKVESSERFPSGQPRQLHLKVVKLIQEKGLDTVKALGVNVVPSIFQPGLVLLKYNDIVTNRYDPVVTECRGLILDTKENYRPVCYPFKRFFNLGEGPKLELDWESARVQEKLDGSLICLWFYNHSWNVSTSGHPDAGGPVKDKDITFKELFWRVFQQLGYVVPSEELRGHTFMFELMTPDNKVVVQHKDNSLVLIGIRGSDGEERHIEHLGQNLGYKVVRTFPFKSAREVVDFTNSLKPTEQEGFVVVDKDFHRVKVKSSAYIELHNLISSMNKRSMLELVRGGEAEECLLYFPDLRSLYDEISGIFFRLAADLEETWAKIRDISDRKKFAEAANEAAKLPGCMFALKDKDKDSVLEYLKNVNIRKLMKTLGLSDKGAIVGARGT